MFVTQLEHNLFMPEFNNGYSYWSQSVVDEWYDGLNDCYTHSLSFDVVSMYLESINDEECDYV